MKKTIILAVMALLLSPLAFAQVGIGTKTPAPDAILDLTAPEKALLVTRVANTAAVTAPVNGMIIYDISSGCIKSYQSGAWTECNAKTTPTVGTLDCANALISGSLTATIPASNVTATIPYTGANGGNYAGQIVSSTGVSGLTATIAGGVLANGDGEIIYTITGTPSGPGTASFAITLIDKTCTFTINVAQSTPQVASLGCLEAVVSGTPTANEFTDGVFVSVPYTGGNGTAYDAQSIASDGVLGLTASLAPSTLANGNGTLVFQLSGTPAGGGVASFALTLGGQSCSFTVNVVAPPTISSWANCSSATAGTLVVGVAASGVTQTATYNGGNGVSYPATSITSSGVTGLTANLAAGVLANGTGSIVFTITGTPATSGTAIFNVNLFGANCTFSRIVEGPAVAALTCTSAVFSPTTMTQGVAYTGTVTVPYTGGNGAPYPAGTAINSTGVTGLTATLQAGTLAVGNGTLTYTVSGTPNSSGTASFALSLGASCTLNKTVNAPLALNCAGRTFSPTTFTQNVAYSGTVTVPYTNGNGTSYPAGTAINSTGVTGLTATLQAGTLANGSGNLTYTISGTPTSSGTASFAISFGGQSCTISFSSCGAFIAPGVFKVFLCHNLGAHTDVDPHTPRWELNGAYIRWGKRGPTGVSTTTWITAASNASLGFAAAPTGGTAGTANSGAITNWTNGTSDGGAGAWSDATKTANDPCPAGFRIPTKAQWDGMRNNNNRYVIGTFTSGVTNYNSAQRFGTSASNITLTLPMAGWRSGSDGALADRNNTAYYWHSSGIRGYYEQLQNSLNTVTTEPDTSWGASVRCIAE